jgi:Spy/CpxP family protein refolding chaperone
MRISTASKWIGASVGLACGFVMLSGFSGKHPFDPEKADKFITFQLNDMLDDINATPDQRQKVLAVKDKILSTMASNRSIRESTHEVIATQWKSDKPDAAAIHAAIDKEFDAMRAAAHAAADQAIEIHAILTPEQREQVGGKLHGILSGSMMGPGMMGHH